MVESDGSGSIFCVWYFSDPGSPHSCHGSILGEILCKIGVGHEPHHHRSSELFQKLKFTMPLPQNAKNVIKSGRNTQNERILI